MAAVCGTSGIASLFSQAAFASDSDIADGQTQRFDFSVLQSMAHDLAQKPWGGAPRPLPNTLATMTPQAYNSIQYDAEQSLWHNVENRQLDTQFFHMGMGFRRRVRMFSVDPATHLAREIHFRPELFKYNDAGVDTKQLEGQSDLGFAGFRVFKAPELARRDVVSFLGASYFRAVDDTYQYGLSARGLAIDTYTDSKEEFPDFTAFWFDTVKPGATTFTVYALLDSPSITGAYKFTIQCEKSQVIMDVENHLYARKDIKQLGIAPMTSMFSCGTNERRMCDTIHPQIHDSDRLSMWRGNGEWICRPLNNPQKLQFNAYTDNNPKGFGLLQLDRDFSHYQDIMGWYNKRPSLWVEPRNKWGKGTIGLMENMPAVIFSVVIGTGIGLAIHLGERINAGAGVMQRVIGKFIKNSNSELSEDEFMNTLVTIIVLFCASGTGIYGSIVSGMSGDHSVLISKSILDLFTAAIFACSLGMVVCMIAIPQVIIFLILFFAATAIFPLTTPGMINDFKACGGFLMLATGFRMVKLKNFPTADMIPAMVLIMPMSWFWVNYILPLVS